MKPTLTIIAALGWMLAIAAGFAIAEEPSKALARAMKTGDHVLMLRHAHAPGFGDPENFKIGDCNTQRNLNSEGRAQAARIGKSLREMGIRSARVFSSQWCRCVDTARALALGEVVELPALNSFFDRPQDKVPNLDALKSFLAAQPPEGKLIVLVTHMVTIYAMTGQGVGSGEGVVAKRSQDGSLVVVGRLAL